MKTEIYEGNDDKILNISLSDILTRIDSKYKKYYWKILWIQASMTTENIGIGDMNILEFEKITNNLNENGYLISFEKLLLFSNKINQLTEILIVVDKKKEKLIRYSNDFEMYKSCLLTIELYDSSSWKLTYR